MVEGAFFFILAFVVFVGIIMASENLTTAMLIASLLTNFLVLSLYMGKIKKLCGPDDTTAGFDSSNTTSSDDTSADNIDPDGGIPSYNNPNTNYAENTMYRDQYIAAGNFKDSYFTYSAPQMCDVGIQGIDNANIVLNRANQRDKKCFDGLASKNANYFKPHFGSEFVDSENKIWWDENQ